jgi:DNA polymerase III epsilon subunit-like protein
MSILVLDLETTGLPGRENGRLCSYDNINKYNSCRIVQISIGIFNNDGKELEVVDYLVKPLGFIIENSQFHGVTQERALEEGVTIKTLISYIKKIYKSGVRLIVAHNIEFDVNVLLSELMRAGTPKLAHAIYKIPKYCTMQYGIEITKLKPYLYGSYKYPKLCELYKHLFDEDVKNQHDAFYDMKNTARCYFAMIEL